MGSRTMPTYCEHGVCIDGGDFVEAENCPQCHAVNMVCPCCAMAQKNITRLKQRVEALEDAMRAILGEEAGFDETESLAKIFILARQALEGK